MQGVPATDLRTSTAKDLPGMSSRTEDLTTLQAQLAEKNDLVAALTTQLERTATQLDRLTRAGAERTGYGAPPAPASAPALPPETSSKLTQALDDWQEFQPVQRIERIESGIERIIELLESAPAAHGAHAVDLSSAAAAPASSAATAEDFWATTKARLLGESAGDSGRAPPAPPPDGNDFYEVAPRVAEADSSNPFSEIGSGPEPPTPITDFEDLDELQAGIKSRDTYFQYLISRLRLAETKAYFPTDWGQLAKAPRHFQERLESLETVLKDHLRQAEVANSLERALLARERAKLAQIKQNLETQIKKMAHPATPSPSQNPPRESPPDQKSEEQESRWKRIFSR